jgi:hypothetical protein
MLLRPVLLASVAKGRPRGEPANAEILLDNSLAMEVCSLCVKTAQVLLETLYENLDSSYRSPGWHVVYCECQCLRLNLETGTNPPKLHSLEPLFFSQHIYPTWCRLMSTVIHSIYHGAVVSRF